MDPRRVYAAGPSAGGVFTLALACERPGLFTAFAPVIANFLDGDAAACRPGEPVPIFFFHGTEDPLIPFEGGFGVADFLPATATVEHWAQGNGCVPAAEVTTLPDTDPGDGTAVEKRDYGCNVLQYVILGGGHVWPGMPGPEDVPLLGRNTQEISATETLWDLFSAYPGGEDSDGDGVPDAVDTDDDGDGNPDEVEAQLGTDPERKDNDVFASPRLFVRQVYRDFLDREGDASGIEHWVGELTAARTNRAQIIDQFLLSPEFADQVAPVVRLYFAYFQRVPDHGGLTYWVYRRTIGQSLIGVSEVFAASDEFVATYGELDDAEYVRRVYLNVLGREPDRPGFDDWMERLEEGSISRGGLMLAFSESEEHRALVREEVVVTMLYAGMMRRAPDPSGFEHWVGLIEAGLPRVDVIRDFYQAPEYRARFLPADSSPGLRGANRAHAVVGIAPRSGGQGGASDG